MKLLHSLILVYLAVLATACAQNKKSDTSSELRIISYNIRLITDYDKGDFAWDARKECSINMILTEKPDIIGLQEPHQPQIDYLVAQLPQYGYVETDRDAGLLDDGEHVMVMWDKERFDLLDPGHFWLSETPEEVSIGWDAACRRVAVWVRLKEKSTGKELHFFNTHLDHIGETARLEGAKLIVTKMKEIAGEDATVFLAGDMNVAQGSAEAAALSTYTEWMGSVREDAPETDNRGTFNGFGSEADPSIIDYIHYRNATPLRYETLDGDSYGTRYISDHFPILGIFTY